MSKIVQQLIEEKKPLEEIMLRLGMEREEVVRLATRAGIPASAIISANGFGKEWVPK